MKKLYIVANWKSNKNKDETYDWMQKFLEEATNANFGIKEIIVCPPFTGLPHMHTWVKNHQLSFMLGAQDVSPFDGGAYTGEIHAAQLKDFADYVIIGHSERRKYFSETDDMLSQKVQKALDNNLTPIFCVQGEDTPIPEKVTLVAYEPIFAIGTGKPDTPDDAQKVAGIIKGKNPFVKHVLYGGSVTPDDVNMFTKMPSVDGVLVGGASLDAEKFMQIIKNS